METVYLDIAGPVVGLEKAYFLVLVDKASRWPEIYPMRGISSLQVLQKL